MARDRYRKRVIIASGSVFGLVVAYFIILKIFDDIGPIVLNNFLTVVLTAILVASTILYVVTTHGLAVEATRANELNARNFERSLALSAPALILANPTGFTAERKEDGTIYVEVAIVNVGGGVAAEIEIDTDWQTFSYPATIPGSVGTGSGVAFHWRADFGRPDTGTEISPPMPTEFRFTDLGGTRYRQPVGGRPEVVAP